MQLLNACAKHINTQKPKHRSQIAQMLWKKTCSDKVCLRTCIVLAYAYPNTTGPSIPNSKTFQYVWAILQLSRPKPNSKEVKVRTKRSYSEAMEIHGGGRALQSMASNWNGSESMRTHVKTWESKRINRRPWDAIGNNW